MHFLLLYSLVLGLGLSNPHGRRHKNEIGNHKTGRGELICSDGCKPTCSNGLKPLCPAGGCHGKRQAACPDGLPPLQCADGNAPIRPLHACIGGRLICKDNSEPKCEDGSKPKQGRCKDRSMPVCSNGLTPTCSNRGQTSQRAACSAWLWNDSLRQIGTHLNKKKKLPS